MMTRKMIWNLARCVFTLALVFVFTTSIVGCAEQNTKTECGHKCSKECSKECMKAGDKGCPNMKDAKPADKPATPAPAPVAKPAAPAPAPVKPAAEKPAGHP